MSFDPHNVEATLSHDGIETLHLHFEHDGREIDQSMKGYFDPEDLIKSDCIPAEDGVSTMDKAIGQARHGYDVSIKIHHERACQLALAPAY